MGTNIEFASNGGTAQGYLAQGSGGPGLVVIQEWWGLNDNIRDICDRYAAEGFTALAPDLYNGKVTTEPDEAGKTMMALNMAQAAKDMSGAVDEVATRSGHAKVGVTGFCMGGGLTLVLGCQRPDKVAAVAPYYGLIPWPDAQPDFSKLAAAVQGHYAEKDEYFTPDLARALAQQLKDLGKDVEMVIHPGTDHAFFNDTRPEVHDAAESAKAWSSTLAFFRSHLS